jgi:hypothetical protein
MHDSRRYRDSAAECLLAAQGACELHCRRLHLSMADSWLSLARRDEAMDNLLASWDTAEPVKTDGLGASFPVHQASSRGTGYRPAPRRESRAA